MIGKKSACESHIGLSLVNIILNVLPRIIVRRLSNVREKCTREYQMGFRLGRIVLNVSLLCGKC